MTLTERYNAVMKKFTAAELLSMPEQVKETLQKATDLETKVKLFEAIADAMKK